MISGFGAPEELQSLILQWYMRLSEWGFPLYKTDHYVFGFLGSDTAALRELVGIQEVMAHLWTITIY